jgi:purine catabolism regulator
MAVTAGKRYEGVFVFGKGDRLGPRDRLVVHHAVTVLGLLLASRRAVIDAERRVAGDILSDAFAGRLTGPDLDRKIELLGFQPAAPLTAMIVEASRVTDAGRLEDLAWTVDGVLGSRSSAVRTTILGGRIAALVSHDDPLALARSLAEELDDKEGLDRIGGSVRIGVGESVDRRAARHSYLSAVFALRATRPEAKVASPADLGSYAFLLGAQSPNVLQGYVASVLGPLIERDEQRNSELVESVKAFVEHGGRWEAGAEALGVHRHTLRYRIHQAEELLGRDLSSPQDQMEVWLALKAMDVLGE